MKIIQDNKNYEFIIKLYNGDSIFFRIDKNSKKESSENLQVFLGQTKTLGFIKSDFQKIKFLAENFLEDFFPTKPDFLKENLQVANEIRKKFDYDEISKTTQNEQKSLIDLEICNSRNVFKYKIDTKKLKRKLEPNL